MAGQFRLRLPWLSETGALRSSAESQPSRSTAAPTPAPVQPTPSVSAPRPPFRPAGIAPVRPPPPPVVTRTEPQPRSPLRATTEPKATVEPRQPSTETNRTQATTVPSLPLRATAETPAAPQPEPPTRSTVQAEPLASPQQTDESALPSASRAASQQKPVQTSQLPSLLRPKTEESSQPPAVSSKPPSITAQLEELKLESVPEVKFGTVSDTASAREKKVDPTLRPETATEESLTSRKPDSAINVADKTLPLTKPVEKVEDAKEEKITGPSNEECTKTTDSAVQAKELLSAKFEALKKPLEESEIINWKKPITVGSDGEKVKTVSSSLPKARTTLTESYQKPLESNREPVPPHREIREDISKLVRKLGTARPNQETDENPFSNIILAGDNKGAIMHIGLELAKKDGALHIHQGYKLNPEATTDGEERSKRRSKDLAKEELVTKTYVNNNIQSVNNSVVFGSSVTERDPGVRIFFTNKQLDATKSRAEDVSLMAQKAEFSVTPSEKLTHESTVMTRSLRGLFPEPSDSDPENPENPRRHGCLYAWEEKIKDKDYDVRVL